MPPGTLRTFANKNLNAFGWALSIGLLFFLVGTFAPDSVSQHGVSSVRIETIKVLSYDAVSSTLTFEFASWRPDVGSLYLFAVAVVSEEGNRSEVLNRYDPIDIAEPNTETIITVKNMPLLPVGHYRVVGFLRYAVATDRAAIISCVSENGFVVACDVRNEYAI